MKKGFMNSIVYFTYITFQQKVINCDQFIFTCIESLRITDYRYFKDIHLTFQQKVINLDLSMFTYIENLS